MFKSTKVLLFVCGLFAYLVVHPVVAGQNIQQSNVSLEVDETDQVSDIACKVFGLCD